MSQTRREFLVTTTAGVCAAALCSTDTLVCAPLENRQECLFYMEGDPYTAHVDECGLGARSWDDAREHALRFRSTPGDRDRYVLGVED